MCQSFTQWRAGIITGNRQRHLGFFDTAQEAGRAHDRAALYFKGGECKLNFRSSRSVVGGEGDSDGKKDDGEGAAQKVGGAGANSDATEAVGVAKAEEGEEGGDGTEMGAGTGASAGPNVSQVEGPKEATGDVVPMEDSGAAGIEGKSKSADVGDTIVTMKAAGGAVDGVVAQVSGDEGAIATAAGDFFDDQSEHGAKESGSVAPAEPTPEIPQPPSLVAASAALSAPPSQPESTLMVNGGAVAKEETAQEQAQAETTEAEMVQMELEGEEEEEGIAEIPANLEDIKIKNTSPSASAPIVPPVTAESSRPNSRGWVSYLGIEDGVSPDGMTSAVGSGGPHTGADAVADAGAGVYADADAESDGMVVGVAESPAVIAAAVSGSTVGSAVGLAEVPTGNATPVEMKKSLKRPLPIAEDTEMGSAVSHMHSHARTETEGAQKAAALGLDASPQQGTLASISSSNRSSGDGCGWSSGSIAGGASSNSSISASSAGATSTASIASTVSTVETTGTVSIVGTVSTADSFATSTSASSISSAGSFGKDSSAFGSALSSVPPLALASVPGSDPAAVHAANMAALAMSGNFPGTTESELEIYPNQHFFCLSSRYPTAQPIPHSSHCAEDGVMVASERTTEGSINGNNVATVSGTNSETVDAAARIEAGLALSASSTSGSTSPGGSGSASDGVGDSVGVGVGGVVVGFVDGMEVDGKIDDDDGEDPSSNASAPKRGKGVLRFR